MLAIGCICGDGPLTDGSDRGLDFAENHCSEVCRLTVSFIQDNLDVMYIRAPALPL